MLVVIESEYSFLNRPGLLDPRPGEGPGSLHFYQEMLLLWSGDPAVRTAVLEEDEEAETGAGPPISRKERDWRSSLADSCCPKAGLGARVHAVRMPGSMPRGCQGPCREGARVHAMRVWTCRAGRPTLGLPGPAAPKGTRQPRSQAGALNQVQKQFSPVLRTVQPRVRIWIL